VTGAGERVVDIHAHFVAPALLDEARRHPRDYQLSVLPAPDGSDEIVFDAGIRVRPVFPRLRDVGLRLREMDAGGVDIALLSTWMDICGYWLEGPAAVRWARLQNDTLAAVAREHPERLRAAGTLPLQLPPAAAAEVDYVAKQLGLRAIELAANFGGRDLDDPALDPVWRRIQDHGLLLFLHPHHHAPPPRLDRYFLSNLIGNPLDTTIGFARLVFGGVLDRFPGLRFVLAHGGGYVPYQIGRLDRGWEVRPECRETKAGPPRAYLRHFWFDTLLFDTARIEFLLDAVGPERVVFGTDCPFPLGDPAMLDRVRAVPTLGDRIRAVLADNALALLGE
jgi:aminocarboxymuconate-semialdehyde decarboxylase